MSEYLKRRQSELKKWSLFIKERFDPLSHFVMIALFICSFYISANALGLLKASALEFTLLIIFVVLFFLKLRFYDEIKDYETDLIINPTRALPRGLLSLYEVKRAIEWTLLAELLILAGLGNQALFIGLVALSYGLLMYREFFIGPKIRPHLTTYATSHTFITFLLALTMMSALTKLWPWELPLDLIKFSLMAWPLFNIFEFGRKTFQPSEERQGVETYSKIWTKPGAFALVISQALLALWLMLSTQVGSSSVIQSMGLASMALLIFIGLLYIFSSSPFIGKVYRAFSSFYIVLVYVSFLFYHP